MSVELLPYEHVPQGFEVVIGGKEVCPGSKGGIWNLRWNVQLTDDPGRWDEEIVAINGLQRSLDSVDPDHRLIRAKVAELCRISPLFPESVEILCGEIGEGRMSKPFKLGCEGRNLLESMGYHDEGSMEEQKTHIERQYSRALGRWLEGAKPETPLDSKVSGFLGGLTEKKRELVMEIMSVLDSDDVPYDRLLEVCGDSCMEQMGANYDTRARPLHCLGCEMAKIEGGERPRCSCMVGNVIDASALCTRFHDGWRALLSEHRRFAEECILAYSIAVNSWLEGEPAGPVTSIVDFRYLTDSVAADIPERVGYLIGARDGVKEWLATCLLKTLKGNQRWHETKELIDGHPGATSYLAKLARA